MKYQQGQSGNPEGRPKGAQSKRTQLAKLLEQHAEALVNKTVELALSGDGNALRLCIERLIPKAKDGTANIILPLVDTSRNNAPLEIGREILKKVSGQEITLDQAKSLLGILKFCDSNTSVSEGDEDIEKLKALMKKYERDY